jgi:hypothetical protein
MKTEPIYRIGLFGWSNAGKTSLIVALSDSTQAVVEGQIWTIQYLPPVEGKIEDQAVHDKRVRGERLLKEAKDAIKHTAKPEATVESENTTLYWFQLACGGSVRTVELCDYAGEILTPNRLDRVESHGHTLAKRVAECDAVFVLAPASDETPNSDVDKDRTHQVAQSLAILHSWIEENDPLKRTQRRPFAVLVTKVDRVSPVADAQMTDMGQPAELVWDKVQSLIGSTFTRWFGLTMLPTVGQPSGLIEPLVWSMNVADESFVEDAENATKFGLLDWRPKRLGGGQGKRYGLNRASDVVGRRPAMADDKDPIAIKAKKLHRSLYLSRTLYRSALAFALIGLTWIGLSVVDSVRTNGFMRIAEDPESTTDDLNSAEIYFSDFGSRILRPSFLGLSSDEADGFRDAARNQIAEKLWVKVLKEIDIVEKGEIAERYRGSEHHDEAIELTKAGKAEYARRRYAAWLEPLVTTANQNDLSMDSRAELLLKLSSLPTNLIETPAQREDRLTLRDRVQEDQQQAQAIAKRQVIVQQIENLVGRQRPFEALAAISVRPESFDWDEMQPTLDLLRKNWQSDINTRLVGFKANEQFDQGIQTLQKAIRDRKLIPESAKLPLNPDFEKLLASMKGDWDKTDYGNFKRRPSITSAEAYLNAAHPKCMEQTVKKWVKWKESEDSSRALRPHLESMTWDNNKGATDPIVDFYANGKAVFKKKYAGDGDYGATYEFPRISSSMEFSPDDSVEFHIVLRNNNFDWYGDAFVGEYKGTFRFSDLVSSKGAAGTLSSTDGKSMHRFRIRLLGMPIAPYLLEWQPCP